MFINVKKRDNRIQKWTPNKVASALKLAMDCVEDSYSDEEVDSMVERVAEGADRFAKENKLRCPTVEAIQDCAENVLMDAGRHAAAKAFILYRDDRTRVRDSKSSIFKTVKEIVDSNIRESNILRDNANESGATPAGAYGKIASETNKMYNLLNNISRKFAEEHRDGHLHIHDLNQYNLTFNCLFAPIGELLARGFDSGTGFIRKTKRIESAAQVAAVIMQLQSNQQYGGIADDNIDFDLAPFVDVSFKKNLAKELVRYRVYTEVYDESVLDGDQDDENTPLGKIVKQVYTEEIEPAGVSLNQPVIQVLQKLAATGCTRRCIRIAIQQTDTDTFEAMEGLVTNLNSLQSRSGNQVPFSSLNFGLDTSTCGRMVSKNLIKAQYAGMGDGLTAIFPILIFKLMKGYTKNENDPNYDLYLDSIKCTASRFYPNFVSVDATFNKPYVRYDVKEIEVDAAPVVRGRGTNDAIIALVDKYNMGDYPEYMYEVAPGEYWEVVSYSGSTLKVRKLKPETTIATMGCARGDETITVRIDGVVYRNIKISEAYDMIHEMARMAETEEK